MPPSCSPSVFGGMTPMISLTVFELPESLCSTIAFVSLRCISFMSFFFFQAEDGIRDDLVTGVQTCALPIFHEDLRDFTQGLVADRVAELVVDALEAVEVEEHDRHGVAEAPEARDLLLEAQGEEASVVEPGHVVTERGLFEYGVRDLELLVGGVEVRRERVDLDRLLLDRPEHAGERLHQCPDLVAPGAERRGVRLL